MAEHLISLKDVSKSIAGRVLFESLTMGIDKGDKIGLIGANGAGKSTLLRVLCGETPADDGDVNRRRDLRMRVVTQLPDFEDAKTGREVLHRALGPAAELVQRYEKKVEDVDWAGSNEAASLLEAIEAAGGWEIEHRIEGAASVLGLNTDKLDSDLQHYSGGERKRLSLAALSLSDVELVVLDEPTNHLDAETVSWLENWLGNTSAAVIVVTHDRYFLDAVAKRMLELRGGELRGYRGGYTDYVAQRVIEEANRTELHHRRLRHLMGELAWAKKSPQARTTKSQSRLDRVEESQKEVEKLGARAPELLAKDFAFGEAPRLGNTILELRDLSLGYGEKPLVQELELRLRAGERIGILGPNGAGKTTLFKAIAGTLKPMAGEIVHGKNTQIAYLDQERSILPEDETTTLEEVVIPEGGDSVFFGDRSIHIASWMSRFGFLHGDLSRPLSTLSGGERNRLALARFLLEKANVLLLDEPTNDLDIETIGLLEDALADFKGCVLVISHDRYFIDKVVTGVLVYEAIEDGSGSKVFYQPGGYTDYTSARGKVKPLGAPSSAVEMPVERRAPAEDKSQGGPAKKQKSNLTFAERIEFETAEAKVDEAEEEVARLQALLEDPTVWHGQGEEGRELQVELESAQAGSEKLFERWQYLADKAGE